MQESDEYTSGESEEREGNENNRYFCDRDMTVGTKREVLRPLEDPSMR